MLYEGNKTAIEAKASPQGRNVDLVFPIFTVLQFIFYVGWLKVGQYLMRPFDDDDDDFELNYILDRHFQLSMALVDDYYCHDPASTDDIGVRKTRLAVSDGKCKDKASAPPKLHSAIRSRSTVIDMVKNVTEGRPKSRDYCYF